MTIWQAVGLDEIVIYQADSAIELAEMLSISPKAVYMALYRQKTRPAECSGSRKHYLIVKVVITDD